MAGALVCLTAHRALLVARSRNCCGLLAPGGGHLTFVTLSPRPPRGNVTLHRESGPRACLACVAQATGEPVAPPTEGDALRAKAHCLSTVVIGARRDVGRQAKGRSPCKSP